MYLYYINCSFLSSGDIQEILRSRMLKMCEKDLPRAILVSGEIQSNKHPEAFVKALKRLKIPILQSESVFNHDEYHDAAIPFIDILKEEAFHPKNNILYKIHLKEITIERIYMNLFIHHGVIEEPDLIEQIEERMRKCGKEVSTIVIKQRMH